METKNSKASAVIKTIEKALLGLIGILTLIAVCQEILNIVQKE